MVFRIVSVAQWESAACVDRYGAHHGRGHRFKSWSWLHLPTLGRFPSNLAGAVQSNPGHSFRRTIMDKHLKAAVEHHRGIIAKHEGTPYRIPLESVVIGLLGTLIELQMNPTRAKKKAAAKPK
jgi:hypothetical protein